MTQKQPVYFISNRERRDDFLIETRVWKHKDTFKVEKCGVTPAAKTHLQHMFKTYESLLKVRGLNKITNIVPAKQKNDSIEFPFIQGTSGERVLLEQILHGHEKDAIQTIERLFTIIDTLPTIKKNPVTNPSYVAVFGSSFDREQECTKLGIVDLNLDNFMIDSSDAWHLYDYEWVFDFPVPKDFLRIRFLWYFLYRHREVLKFQAAHIKSVEVNSEIFIPSFIFDVYSKYFDYFDDLRTAESTFQKFVTNKNDRKFAKIGSDDFVAKESQTPTVGVDAFLDREIKTKTSSMMKENASLKERNELLETRLNRITQTKPYRVARKLVRIKRKIVS